MDKNNCACSISGKKTHPHFSYHSKECCSLEYEKPIPRTRGVLCEKGGECEGNYSIDCSGTHCHCKKCGRIFFTCFYCGNKWRHKFSINDGGSVVDGKCQKSKSRLHRLSPIGLGCQDHQ